MLLGHVNMHCSNKSNLIKKRSAARHASPTLRQAFLMQCRVIYALIMREIHTRYGRDNIGFLWVVGEPILFCAGVAIVWTAIRPSHEHGLQMTGMVISGYVPLTIWRHTVARAIKAYAVNSTLLYHRLVTPLDIIISRITLEVVGAVLAGAIVMGGALALGYVSWPESWVLIYEGMGFCIYFSYGLAIIIASLTEVSDLLEKAMSVLMYLSLPLSGAFVMVEWIPARYRWILELSPLAESIEMIRYGMFGIKVVPHYSISYLFVSCSVMFMIGVYLTLKIRPHIDLV